jgi:hypothetical protein
MFVHTIVLPGGLLPMSDDGERRLFSLLFPFVRPLVTDSNLSFDANNICPIYGCLRRKKEEEFQNEEKGKKKKDMKKKMDIVHIHIHIYLYGNASHLVIDRRKEKKMKKCHRYVQG